MYDEIKRLLTDVRFDLVEVLSRQCRQGTVDPAEWHKLQGAAHWLSQNRFSLPKEVADGFNDLLLWVQNSVNELLDWIREQIALEKSGNTTTDAEFVSRLERLWGEYEQRARSLLDLAQSLPPNNPSEKITATPRHDMESPPPLALVMKGGGIKGIAYVGALEVLVKTYDFNWFIGTSAGAIAAVLLAAGYSIDELSEILRTKNFGDFFDTKWYQLPFNLNFHKGLYHADSLTKWIDTLLAKKLRSPVRVTLNNLPKRVTVYASCREKRVLTFDSTTSVDVAAAYAVRCSMSIPLLFVPQSHQGFRTYDGGIQYNYPVDKLREVDPDAKFVGLYLGPEVYEGIERTSVLADIVSIVMESSDPDNITKYPKSTVIIDTHPINTLDFSLTNEEKEFLLQAGRTAALAHINHQSQEYAAAVKKRDVLRQSVVNARRDAAKKRRRLRWCIVAILLLSAGLCTFYLRARGPNPTPKETVAPKHGGDFPVVDIPYEVDLAEEQVRKVLEFDIRFDKEPLEEVLYTVPSGSDFIQTAYSANGDVEVELLASNADRLSSFSAYGHSDAGGIIKVPVAFFARTRS